jgi:extracellular factor (EF) 3-hydroxypalmitic acid methyl ester biosynthesis protein
MAGSRSAASEPLPPAEAGLRLTARLPHQGHALAVQVERAGRLSLAVDAGAVRIADGTVFPSVEVLRGDAVLRLGRCRFSAPGRERAAQGRLVFLDAVYDCEQLLREGRVVDLRGGFQNLPLVLAQRAQVRPEFERWAAGLIYDLAVHARFLDDHERLLEGEPEDVAEAAQAAVEAREGAAFLAFLEEKDRELDGLVAGFSKEDHERHGFVLRRMAWPYLMRSEIHRRTNLKPRGYAGDADMMRLLYENAPVGARVFDRLLHLHAVRKPSADAVRARRGLVAGILAEVDRALGHPAPFRFLSVACGPAWELRDVYAGRRDARRLEGVLLDQDPAALDHARASAAAVQAEHGPLRLTTEGESVRTMLRDRALRDRLGRFHLVYSMGLFDYLTPPVARAVLARLLDLVLPGGAVVVGNYHVSNRSRVYMDYWMDWPLYYRTEESFLAVAEGLPARIAIQLDPTGSQMFLRLDRLR